MRMSKDNLPTCFNQKNYTISDIINNKEIEEIIRIETGQITEWIPNNIKEYIDSIYHGFPTGAIILWPDDYMKRRIGKESQAINKSNLLIIDGKNRLLSLYAIFKNFPIKNFNGSFERLYLTFKPRECCFEVKQNTIKNDSEAISDVSSIWRDFPSSKELYQQFMNNLKNSNIEIIEQESNKISRSIDRLYNIKNYPISVLFISSTLQQKKISKIFVRINRQNNLKSKSDLILKMMSIKFETKRRELEKFCNCAKEYSPIKNITSFNHIFTPEPIELLIVAIMVGFRKSDLEFIYSILIPCNNKLPDGEKKDDEIFDKSLSYVLDTLNWHEFLDIIRQAGFKNSSMIRSRNSVIYSYSIFLIAKYDFNIGEEILSNVIGRLFFTISINSNQFSNERIEYDLQKLSMLKHQKDFLQTVEQMIENVLTNDFWRNLSKIILASSFQSQLFMAYCASLDILEAYALFSNVKVSDFIDPENRNTRSIGYSLLFPKKYLEKIGITENREIYTMSNSTITYNSDYINEFNLSPITYLKRFSKIPEDIANLHGLPYGWERMQYKKFLKERSKIISKIIRYAYKRLQQNTKKEENYCINELLGYKESCSLEFKSSLLWDYQKNEITQEFFIPFAVIKTIAAFLNSEGGKIIIGIDDRRKILGIERDLSFFGKTNSLYEWAEFLLKLTDKYFEFSIKKLIKIQFEKIESKIISIINVNMSPKPVFVEYKDHNGTDKIHFFVRIEDSSYSINVKQANQYINTHWYKNHVL